MTPEEAKRLLYNYRDACGRISDKRERLARLRELATRSTSSMEAVRTSGSGSRSRVEDAMVSYIDLEEQIKDEIQRLKNERYRIQETINHMEDEREKRLLELRYIDGWSWVRVCTRLEISETWSRMLHRSACEHFAQAYDNLQDWRGMYER